MSLFTEISIFLFHQSELRWLSNEVQFLRALPPTERIPEKNDRLGLFGKKDDPLNLYLQRLEVLCKDIKQTQKKFMQSKEVRCLNLAIDCFFHAHRHIFCLLAGNSCFFCVI